jgi:hypothetical protein
MRVAANLDASESLYASTAEGQFYEFISEEIDGVRRGYFTVAPTAGELLDIRIKEHREVISGIANTIGTDGLITFETLPTAGMTPTNLTVSDAEEPTTIEIIAWDEDAENRQWQETVDAYSQTTFSIDDLEASRQYDVYVNNTLRDRVATDENGAVEFAFSGKAASRIYRLDLVDEIPNHAIGVLPSREGGPNFRLYRGTHTADYTFFTYDSALETGINSIWIDMDGDGTRDLATVPDAGTSSHVRIFEEDGSVIDGIFPFGKEFTGGIEMVAADVDGDGDEELAVTALGKRISTLKVYDLNDGELQLMDSIRPYDESYTGGMHIAAGDMNNDGDDEIVVGALSQKNAIKVYRWKESAGVLDHWFGKRPYAHTNAGNGFSLAMGDVNFDGNDDMVVGSYTGNSVVRVFTYAVGKGKLKRISTRRLFETSYIGGVDVYTSNVNSTDEEEVLVVGHVGTDHASTLRTYNASQERLTSLGRVAPFGAGYDDGLHLAFVDVDGDFNMEVATSREFGEDKIRVYDKRSGGYVQEDSFTTYDSGFTGGLRLTQ